MTTMMFQFRLASIKDADFCEKLLLEIIKAQGAGCSFSYNRRKRQFYAGITTSEVNTQASSESAASTAQEAKNDKPAETSNPN